MSRQRANILMFDATARGAVDVPLMFVFSRNISSATTKCFTKRQFVDFMVADENISSTGWVSYISAGAGWVPVHQITYPALKSSPSAGHGSLHIHHCQPLTFTT